MLGGIIYEITLKCENTQNKAIYCPSYPLSLLKSFNLNINWQKRFCPGHVTSELHHRDDFFIRRMSKMWYFYSSHMTVVPRILRHPNSFYRSNGITAKQKQLSMFFLSSSFLLISLSHIHFFGSFFFSLYSYG